MKGNEKIRYKIMIKGKVDREDSISSKITGQIKKVDKTKLQPNESMAILCCCLKEIMEYIFKINDEELKKNKSDIKELMKEAMDIAEAEYQL